MKTFILINFVICLTCFKAVAKNIHIGPYLTNPSANSITIKWEGKHSNQLKFSYGNSVFLSENWIKPKSFKIPAIGVAKGRKLYSIKLSHLNPDTRYHYLIKDGNFETQIYNFRTLPKISRNFTFLAMSDAQSGFKNTARVIKENVLLHAFEKNYQKTTFPIDFTLFAGDLVQNGNRYEEWKKHFFDPLAPLLIKTPIIPAIGNHEFNHKLYFSYFDFPENGTPRYLGHWYYFDNSNVRFIGLDTNIKYRKKVQLNWLKGVLNEAEKKTNINFVIAFFHHPHKSELWPIGNVNFSGKIKELMEGFSDRSKKPSVHLCGHTHGYSRGHSFKSNHTMINVAAIGGNLDEWGEYKQTDYPEYLISASNFGWMMGQVEVGESPKIRFRRFSHGDNHSLYDMGVIDEFIIKKNNQAPKQPTIIKTTRKNKDFSIKADQFSDPERDGHFSTHIQISKDQNFKKLAFEKIYRYKNVFKGKNTSRGVNLENISFNKKIRSRNTLYTRIRYRDKALAWSEWSEKAKL